MARQADQKQTRRKGRFGPLMLVSLALALGLAWGALTLASGRALVAPDWLTDEVEARATKALGAPGRIELGGIVAVLGEGRVPRIVMRDLRLLNAVGAEVARVPELRARFSARALLRGEIALTRLTVVGAELTMRRDRFGRFDLAFGGTGGGLTGLEDLPAILDAIDRAFARPALGQLDRISGEALRLTFQDALTGQLWRAENGRVTLQQTPEDRRLSLGFALAGGAGAGPADMRLSLTSPRDGGALELAMNVANVTAADIATQVPALAWLSATDAPLAANLRGQVSPVGALQSFDGTLEIGAGAIRPPGAAKPIPFDGAKMYLSFDPAAARIDFSDITASTPEARFSAGGHAYLRGVDPASGLPAQLLVQLDLSQIVLNPAGELVEPARFDAGAADMRLTLAPLKLEVGQIALTGGGRTFRAGGVVEAKAEGWDVSLDLALDRIRHDRLFALWPVRVVPKTRLWLTENVTEGLLYDVNAALRLSPGSEPRLALDYEFRNGKVRFMRTLPPIENGAGHASIIGTQYTMAVQTGQLTAPNGETVDAGGSVFIVRDITQRPATAEIRLETDSTIPAALAILDQPPFEFLTKAGRDTDIATGRARMSAVMELPLRRGVRLPDMVLDVTGQLTDLRSETLIPGKVLTARAMTLTADNDGLQITGAGQVGQARFQAAWNQPFAPDQRDTSRVEGRVVLNQAFLDEFNIGLPRGTVSGAGAGEFALQIARGQPVTFSLTSDLNRLGLSVPALGWSKGRSATGELQVAGALGRPVRVDTLTLSAPGLLAEGRVVLNADNSLDRVQLSRLRAGGWLDAPVTLTGRGAGRAPAVAVRGGTIDLRRIQVGGQGGGGGGGPITLALDRLIVSEGIVLNGLNAELSTANGLSGRFNGRLAGQAPLQGVLAPSREGTAVRIQAADAGAVLRASGLLQSARRGQLDLTLVPLPGEGRYDGRVAVSNLQIRGAPALADLLGAISVVGLIEQLNGQGIVFGEVTGEFTLEPRGITLRRGSAVGPSLGVSMSGIYDLRSKVMDMRGTVSPIYLLNGIGEIFGRRGEGLFGFNYRLAGPVSQPRTEVNPLSILTPGMFREIFRTAPPQLTQ